MLSCNICEEAVLLAQFDGSAHSQSQVGGAGGALYRASHLGLELIDWESVALPQCKGNIVAETYAANICLQLFQKYRTGQLLPGGDNIERDTIQGDIKPILQHLQFTGRFRRQDLISAIDHFHLTRSLFAPKVRLIYRPREVNFVADYLAGQGGKHLLVEIN